MGDNAGIKGGGTAGALLLMAMCCLCMAVFSMLSMSTAGAHKRTSDACVAELEGYYMASAEATRDYAAALAAGVPGTYSGTYAISGAQALETEYEIYGEGDGRILSWTPVPAREWAAEEYIEVIH